jgi:hypothetical protein
MGIESIWERKIESLVNSGREACAVLNNGSKVCGVFEWPDHDKKIDTHIVVGGEEIKRSDICRIED